MQLATCLFCVGHECSDSAKTWSLPASCKSAGLQLVWEKEVEVSEMELRNAGLHLDLMSKVYLEGPEWSQGGS